METENREIEKERYYLVVKSNDLIQKTRYSLSTQEQKVLLYLVSKRKPDDNDFQAYCFNLKHLCESCIIYLFIEHIFCYLVYHIFHKSIGVNCIILQLTPLKSLFSVNPVFTILSD